MFYSRKSKLSDIDRFYGELSTFVNQLEERGQDEDFIKKNIKELLVEYFKMTANVDTATRKMNRINENLAKATAKIEATLDQVNNNLMNMDVANDVAEKANEEAKKFNDQAAELADLMAGGNTMMIVIMVFVGLLLAVAVFSNLYATINGPPPKRKLAQQDSFGNFAARYPKYVDPVDYESGGRLMGRAKKGRFSSFFSSAAIKSIDDGE